MNLGTAGKETNMSILEVMSWTQRGVTTTDKNKLTPGSLLLGYVWIIRLARLHRRLMGEEIFPQWLQSWRKSYAWEKLKLCCLSEIKIHDTWWKSGHTLLAIINKNVTVSHCQDNWCCIKPWECVRALVGGQRLQFRIMMSKITEFLPVGQFLGRYLTNSAHVHEEKLQHTLSKIKGSDWRDSKDFWTSIVRA